MRYQILDNFLTPQECQQIIEMARPRLERSTGWDVQKGAATVTEYRNSSHAFLNRAENDTIRNIEQRIAEITNTNVENGEGLQILRYDINQHYKPHWDYFDERFTGNEAVLSRGGQRIITFLVYLNNVPKGGETNFMRLPNTDGSDSLKITPKEGKALWWYNVDEQGKPDPDTMHEGMDVLEGVKWLATKWIRQKEFR